MNKLKYKLVLVNINKEVIEFYFCEWHKVTMRAKKAIWTNRFILLNNLNDLKIENNKN